MSRHLSTRNQSRLSTLPVFASLTPRALAQADALLTEISLPAGQTLCEQGEFGREAFILLAGQAAVIRDGKVIATVKRGDVVGELALLDSGRRTATVKATTDVSVLAMNHREFSSLLEIRGVGEEIRRIAADRTAA